MYQHLNSIKPCMIYISISVGFPQCTTCEENVELRLQFCLKCMMMVMHIASYLV